MNFFRLITLILCMQISLCHAMQQSGSYTVHTGNTASYTIPDELVDKVADVFTSRMVKDLGSSAPEWVSQLSNRADRFIQDGSNAGTVLVSHLTHNLTVLCGGSLVGAIGAYLACTGISRYFDPEVNQDNTKNRSHLKLTALGLSVMAVAGAGIYTFLK